MTDSGHENFPTQPDGTELYPKRMQDCVNEFYTHDKVLPRVAGKDYAEPKY